MSATQNDDTLLEAIDSYPPYTKNQKELLKLLVRIAVDGVADTSLNSIKKVTGIVSRQGVYALINSLKKDEMIYSLDTSTKLKINYEKLEILKKSVLEEKNMIAALKSKDDFINIISNHSILRKSEKETLKAILNKSVNGIASLKGIELTKSTNLSEYSVYSAMKSLRAAGIISDVKNPITGRKSFAVKINEKKLKELELY